MSASRTNAHWTFFAARCKRLSWRFSAAKDFTTRTPLTLSSTIVAISARRAWASHETGNIRLRIATPAK